MIVLEKQPSGTDGILVSFLEETKNSQKNK